MSLFKILENSRKEKLRRERANLAKKIVVGTAAGIAAGSVGGILLAPKSGKETREDIANTASDLSKNVAVKTSQIKDTALNKVAVTKGKIAEAKEKISKYLADKKTSENADNQSISEDEINESEIQE